MLLRLVCNLRAGANQGVERSGRREHGAACGQSFKQNLGRYVADERVLREGTAAEAADGGVETAAAGVVGGADVGCGLIAASVQMDADFDSGKGLNYRGDGICDLLVCGDADGVGER